MNSIDSLLGMIATEAAEESEYARLENYESHYRPTEKTDLLYNLELVEREDGTLEWIE